MMTIFDKVLQFINYWWFRYQLVTELYMVERWERITIHVIFLVLFMLLWIFNRSVLLSITGNWMGVPPVSLIENSKLINL